MGPTRFIIVSAARTGSTLLRYMLASHPGVFAGGELFNPAEMAKGVIPWCPPSDEHAAINSDGRLNRLRQDDPAQFVEELIETTQAWGYPVIGFKWHYWLPNPEEPAGQYMINDKSIQIIHLKRRNLLRQIVSYERALATDQWALTRGEHAPQLPTLTLSIAKVISDLSELEAASRQYDACFKAHQTLELFYEDLAQDPEASGTRALNFLGVATRQPLDVPTQKTGIDSLRSAISNYDELKSFLVRWASFFED